MCSRHCDISGKRWSIQVRHPLSMPLSGPAPVTMTGCFYAAATSRPLGVFADQQLRIGQVFVRRHGEIVGGGLVLVDAPGEVEQRAGAGAVEAALPVALERFGLRLELVHR